MTREWCWIQYYGLHFGLSTLCVYEERFTLSVYTPINIEKLLG